MFTHLETLFNDAVQSDFFAGGLALGLIGAGVATLRLSWGLILRLWSRRVWVSVGFDNRSDAYGQFHSFMVKNAILKHARHVRSTDKDANGAGSGFAPAPGSHWFWHAGRLCQFDRQISDPGRVGHNMRPQEKITVSVLFGRTDLILSWIGEGQKLVAEKVRIGPRLQIYRGDYWAHMGEVPRRPLDTVLVDDDRVERLAADMRWFFQSCDWYQQRGVPWRRGYLLHGPPGTGKSSLIRALASELDLRLACIDIGQTDLSDDGLREALSTAPREALIAIEDIDAIFVGRTSGDKGEAKGVSFSGLLNAIDGVAAQEGRALVMTTNHRDKLDPALIRAGRADMHLELSHVCGRTAQRLFDRFFPDAEDLSDQFGKNLGARTINPSALQGWLLENAADPERAATAQGLRRPKLVEPRAA